MRAGEQMQRQWRRGAVVALLCFGTVLTTLAAPEVLARPLTSFELSVVGLELQVGPAAQSVPKGVTSTVTTNLNLPQVSIPLASLQNLLPQNLTVKGELSGPAFATPLTLSAPAGTPLTLPTLPLLGTYTLRNLRLVSGSETLIAASPSVVTIEAIDDVLVTKVVTRPLSLDEIQQRGIAIDASNFTVLNFTAAVGTESNRVDISFPVVVPKLPPSPDLQAPLPPEPPAVSLPAGPQFPNLVARPVNIVIVLPEGESEPDLPPIPALLVFPGNIGFLHQFFQALLIVTNGAPEGTPLAVQDLTVTVTLPLGEDKVPGTDENPGDDPLRMARIEGKGFVRSLPVTSPGPDGQLGTADDTGVLRPQETGHADFSVEGLKEGVHEIAFEIAGTLTGLPRGPVAIMGRARGAILVRNPNFALTLSHPNVIRRGESYDLFATIVNTSQADANLVSISLDPRGVSGAELLSTPRVEFRTIKAGESATAKFTLRSQRTGAVTATAVQSDDGILGRFSLRTGVGELGIPLSPDTLILPTFANTLPTDLMEAAMGLLGQAHSVATAPTGALPPDVPRISRATVTRLGVSLSEAAMRIRLGESLLRSVEDLLFDFAGSDLADAAFDSLRRRSSQGANLAAAAGAVLGVDAESRGLLNFQEAYSGVLTSRVPHLGVVAGSSSGGATLRLRVSDDASRTLGTLAADGSVSRAIPFGEHLLLQTSIASLGTLDLVTRLNATRYTIEAVATATGSVDIGVVFPGASGIEQARFAAVPVQEGSALTLTLLRNAANTYALAIDDNGDGRPDRTLSPTEVRAIPDRGPEVVSVVQILNQFPMQQGRGGPQTLTDRFGRMVGVLFSERVGAEASIASHYAVEENAVNGVILQPSGRLVVLLLRDSVGPFVPRSLTVTDLRDIRGNLMTPSSVTRPITITIGDNGGMVSGIVRATDGSPLAGATVKVEVSDTDDLGFTFLQTIGHKITDAQGRYQLDFIPLGGFTLTATAPNGLDTVSIRSALTDPGRHLNVDLVMVGRGTIFGTVRSSTGLPVARAPVNLRSMALESFGALTAGDGSYRFERVPVGGFTVTASDADGNRGHAAGTLVGPGSAIQADITIVPPLATVSVSGQVFRADGVTPIPGVPVILEVSPLSGNGLSTFVYTDATASFRFSDVPAGTLFLRSFDPATGEAGTATITLAPGTSDTVKIFFSGLGTITGRVVKPGGIPVPGANVVAGPSLVRADAEGRFTITNLPVGTHAVRGQDPVTLNIGSTFATLLTSGQTVEVTVVLPAIGTITGRVFQADGVTPIPNADVRNILSRITYIPATTDATGRYTFENQRLGTHTIGVVQGNFVTTGTVTLFADGQTAVKDLVLLTGTGRVTGTVIDEGSNNQPVAATVTLFAQVPGPAGFPEMQQFANVVSDAFTGRFAFERVPLGPVSVSARSILRPTPASASGTLTAAGQTLDFPLVLRANVGSISGTVLDPTGAPVGEGVRVSVESLSFPVVTVTTDPSGRFAFAPILPTGGYTLTAEDPISGLKGQTSVSVIGGQDVKVTPRLLGKGSVLVIVKEANGSPVLDGTVELNGGTFLRDKASGVLTPALNGQIRFANITEGPFSVSARDARGLKGLASGTIPRVGAEATVTITLTPAGTITGRFLTPAGAGVPSAQITLTDAGGTPRAFTTSSSDPADLGRFTFTVVPVGSYRLEGFDPASGRRGATGVRVDQDGQTVTADFSEVSLGTVTGTVRAGDGITPVAAVEVRLTPTGLFSQPVLTQSSPAGDFTFSGVSAGKFTIQVSDPVTGLSGAASGLLSLEGETVTVTVLLEPSGQVQGRVLRADGATPVADAPVTLTRPGTPIVRSTQSEVDGRFTFTRIPVGDFRLSAKEPAGIDIASATGRIGGEGEVVTTDLILVGTGTLTGTLRDSDGTTLVAGATVTVASLGANRLALTGGTAGDGTFRFDRVPVGDFSLTARTVGGLGTAARGTIPADGASVAVNLVLEASGTISGLVRLPDGVTAARGVAVTLISPRLSVSTLTDSTGLFLFEGIPLGTFQLDLVDSVGGGIQRAEGSLATNGQAFDAGILVLDDRAIAVSAVTPVDGAVSVPVTTTVTVTFSERVLRSTVTSFSVRVLVAGAPIAGTLAFAANDTQVVFTPAQPLLSSRRYTVQVTTAVTDLVGRALLADSVTTFTTIDTIPPQMVSISPANGAIQVAPEAVVRITFSEAMDPVSVTSSAVTLTGPQGPVAGRVDLILNNTVLVFTPNAFLATDTRFSVTVGALRDVAGNTLTSPGTQTFTTIDTVPPTVGSLSLPAGARTVQGGTVAVTAATLDADVSHVDFFADGVLIGTATAAPFSVPLLLLPQVTPGQMIVTAIAVDRVGNRGTAATLVITVEPPPPPATVTALEPAAVSIRQTLSTTLTVRITPAQPAPTVITLAANIPARLSVPASVTVPPDATSASFSVRGTAQGAVTVTASVNGTSAQSSVTVLPPPASLAGLSPTSLTIFQGGTGTLTVAITPAQPEETVVTLSSSNPSLATVPSTVRFPTGETTATVTVTGMVVSGVVRASATITASVNNTSAQATVTVRIPSGTVTGIVRRGTGEVVPNLSVQLRVAGFFFSTTTNASGQFTFLDVPVGTATLTTFEAASNTAGSAQATVLLDQTATQDVTLRFGGTVVGLVTNASNQAVSGAAVTMIASSGTFTTTTGADGRYRFDAVAPGAVTVQANDPATGLRGRTSGSLSLSGQTLTLNVQLVASGTVVGTVFRSDGTTPVAGAQVSINVFLSGLPTTVTTDSQGRYTFEFVPVSAFTLDATDLATGDRGRAANQINANGETRTINITLNGLGRVVVTVRDASNNLFANAQVTLTSQTQFGGSQSGTTGTDGTVTFERVLAGSFSVSATDPVTRLSGSASGSVAVGATVAVTVQLQPAGTIAGRVFAPDGTTAVAGVTVSLSGPVFRQVTSGTDGSFRFEIIPLGNYSLSAVDSTNRLRAREFNVVLATNGEVVTRNLTFVGLGNVSGRVLNPNATVAPSVVVSLRSANTLVGGFFSATTDSTGRYRIVGVPVGGFTASVSLPAQQLLGETTGRIDQDGQEVTADIQLVNNAITLPVSRFDANNFLFDIQANGSVLNGTNQVYRGDFSSNQGGLLLDIIVGGTPNRFTGGTIGSTEESGREIVVRQQNLAGLDVTRKVFVPRTGYFARYLEILSNPTASPITLDIRVVSNISASFSGSPRIIATSSGDTLLDVSDPTNPDRWVVIDDGTDGDPFLVSNLPAVAFSFDGLGGAERAGAASLTVPFAGQLSYQWNSVTIPPGGAVAYLHFGVQQTSRAAAQASVERLIQLPPEALTGLSAEEIGRIRNFAVPADGVSALAPLPAVSGRVTGRVLASDNATVIPNAQVRLKSLHPLYGRTYFATSSSLGQFAFTSRFDDFGGSVAIPVDSFTLSATHPLSGVVIERTGTFSSGFTGNLSLAGVTTNVSSSFSTSFGPERAIDGNLNTSWFTAVGDAANLGRTPFFEILFPFEANVTQVNIRGNREFATGFDFFRGRIELFDAQGRLLHSQEFDLPAPDRDINLDIPDQTGVRRVRFTGLADESTEPGLAEIEVIGSTTGVTGAASIDVVFTNTGMVRGVVRRHTGVAVTGGSVNIFRSSPFLSVFVNIASDGSYLFTGVPAGSFTLTATVFHPQGTSLTGTTTASVTVGQTTLADITIEPTGTVSGVVRTATGTLAANVFVQLSGSGVSRSTRTDASGQYLLSDVRLGTFTVRATEPNSGVLSSAQVTVVQDQTTIQDFTLIGLGTVQVQVNFANGSPAPAARVAIFESARGLRFAGTTDSAGRLTIANVTVGPFTVSAFHPNNPELFTDVAGSIVNNGDVVPLTIVLPGTGVVTGRVTFANGTAAANALVEVFGNVPSRSVRTDSNGVYTITAVPVGRTFTVRASHPTNSSFFREVANNTLAVDGETLTVNLTLPALATVRVTVLRADNTPFAGAQIEIQIPFRTFQFAGFTDVNGVLNILNVPEGSFSVRVMAQGFFDFYPVANATGTVTPADQGQTINVTITSPPSGNVQGTVFAADGQTPIRSATIEIRDVASTVLITRAITDTNGFYQRSGLLAGSQGFRVTASFSVFTDSSMGAERTASFTTQGETLTLNLTVPASVIRGTVFFSDGITPAPSTSVFVTYIDAAGRVRSFLAQRREADATRAYTFLGVPVGNFTITANETSGLTGAATGTVTDITIPLTVNVILQPSGTVTGTVFDTSNNVVPLANVALTTADRAFDRFAVADAQGVYRFDRVPVGSFSVQARDPNTQIRGSAAGTLTAGGEIATVNVSLPATGTVVGTIFGTDGVTPAPNVSTLVENFNHSGPLGYFQMPVILDSSGNYQATGVPVGAILVTATDANNTVGFASGTLNAGATATINVTLGNATQFGGSRFNLVGADRFVYDVRCDGRLQDGGRLPLSFSDPRDAYDSAYLLRINNQSFPCFIAFRQEENGREIVIGSAGFGGLNVTRKVFVPSAGGFARYLEILSNPTGAPVTVPVEVRADLGGFSTRIVVGPSVTNNTFAVTDQSSACCNPALAHVFGGPNARLAVSATQFLNGNDTIFYRWNVTVPAGETVILMHFAVQRDVTDTAGARAQAEALVNLTDPNALIGMSAQERAQVLNFSIP